MRCIDVNVLIYGSRADSIDHEAYRERLRTWSNDELEPLGVPDVVASGFLRLVTDRRIYSEPTPPSVAWEQIDAVLRAPASRLLRASDTNWGHFRRLADQIDTKADDIPDAYTAAYAVENNATFLSADHGFKRFDGLRWQHPLA